MEEQTENLSRQKIIDGLKDQLEKLCEEEKRIRHQKAVIMEAITLYDLQPFKPGDTVLFDLTFRCRKEERKCVIEVEDGKVFVRPYKKDSNELSGRHYNVRPLNGDYSTIFKRCD